MIRTCWLTLWTLAATLVAACATPPAPGAPILSVETGAISNGIPDDEDTSVLGVVSFGGGLVGMCTGTLISPGIVLTAQHCVAPVVNEAPEGGVDCSITSFGAPYQAATMFVSTRSPLTQNPADYRTIREIVIPDGEGFCGRDVALMVLTSPMPESETVPIVPRIDEPLEGGIPGTIAGGEVYSAIGYGNTSTTGGGSGTRRRRDDLRVTCAGTKCFQGFAAEWIGDTGVCSGDSGGPAVDTLGRVTGVASRGGPHCGIPWYGYVYAIGDWLTEHALRVADENGLAPPKWALGWPTHPAFHVSSGSPCKNGLECASGLCLGGYCSRPCNEIAPCDPGFYCDELAAGATDFDSDYCTLLGVGGDCETNEDCAPGRCLSGQSGPYCTRACHEDLPCPPWHGCSADLLLCELMPVGDPCATVEDCASLVCLEGYCTRSCRSGCPDGYACDEDVDRCVLLPVGGECEADADCDGGPCADGLCTRACHETALCPDGWTCDDEGVCALVAVGGECAEHADCGGGSCVDGTCTRSCDATRAPCPDGWECAPSGECSLIPEPPPPAEGCASAQRSGGPGATLVMLLLMMAWLRRFRSA